MSLPLLIRSQQELMEQLALRQSRCRRVNVNSLNIEISNVQLQPMHEAVEPQFKTPHGLIGFVTQVNIHSRSSFAQLLLDDAGLRELVDVINTYLQRPPAPVQVQVVLQRARKRRAPAAAAEQLDEVATIKRRMLEGR